MDPLKYQSSQKHGHYTIKLPFLRGAIKQHQHNQYLLELAICLSLCEFHSDSINQSKVKNFNPTLKNDTTTKPKYGIYALFQRQSNLDRPPPPSSLPQHYDTIYAQSVLRFVCSALASPIFAFPFLSKRVMLSLSLLSLSYGNPTHHHHHFSIMAFKFYIVLLQHRTTTAHRGEEGFEAKCRCRKL